MNSTGKTKTLLFLVVLLTAGCTAFAQQAQAPPSDQSAPTTQIPSLCGGQPLCAENDNFAATVTSFRISQISVYKVIDVMLHFQNKTNDQLGLGYVVNSGTATDDRGNRYIVYGQNPYRGIGPVYGNNFEPSLVIRTGGSGDAQFELMHRMDAREILGSTFIFDLTIGQRVIQGNMYAVAEFPFHFQGLTDGMTAAPPSGFAPSAGQAAGATGFAPTGGAAPATADNSASQANCTSTGSAGNDTISTITSFAAMFKHKKQAATATARASAPCAPATASAPAAAPAAAPGTAAPAAVAPASTAAPANAPALRAAPAKSAPSVQANAAPAPAARPAAAQPSKAQAGFLSRVAPLKAAAPAPAPKAAAKTQAPATTTAAQKAKKDAKTPAKKPDPNAPKSN